MPTIISGLSQSWPKLIAKDPDLDPDQKFVALCIAAMTYWHNVEYRLSTKALSGQTGLDEADCLEIVEELVERGFLTEYPPQATDRYKRRRFHVAIPKLQTQGKENQSANHRDS